MSKKQNEEALEQAIGGLGGETVESNTQEAGLGRLKYDHSGKKKELDEEEKKSLEEFKARSDKHSVIGRRSDIDLSNLDGGVIPVGEGWIPINRDEMGERSIFYPEDWKFAIRPATVQAIKNWTAIDESRVDQVNDTFNDILKTSVKITSDEGGISWERINDWDRFWFVMKVREYTFTQGESKVEFTDTCSECEEDIDYVLTSDALHYEFPDDDLIEKYWSGRAWEIDPTEYDVDHEPITLYLPTVGKDSATIRWAQRQYQQNGKIDENFVKFIPWLISNPSRDTQMFDRQVQKLYKEYKSWSLDMFTFMNDVLNNIVVTPSNKLRTVCPYCGKEVVSNLRFPDGIKVLFNTATKARKFGSR